MQWLTRLGAGLQALLGLILPVFGQVQAFRGQRARWRVVLHVALVVLITVVLALINNFTDLHKFIQGRPFLAKMWLPGLFLLLYALAFLGRWFYLLAIHWEEASDFPDIDEAWQEAMKELAEQRIDLTRVPVFLVLGRPAGPADEITEDRLFSAARVQFQVQGVPRRPAPLHVYATRAPGQEAVYVACGIACRLGAQAVWMSTAGTEVISQPAPGAEPEGEFDPTKLTLVPKKGFAKKVQAIRAEADKHGRTLSREEMQEINRLYGLDQKDFVRLARRGGAPTGTRQAAETLSARLAHLCRLIARDRQPFCPVNGILPVIPFTATDSREDASQTRADLAADLKSARAALKVNCPRYALVADLESVPGFCEFVKRFPAQQRAARLGQRFPLVPEVDPAAIPDQVDACARWVCRGVFPRWVYQFFRLETPGHEELAAVTDGNGALFRLMAQMDQRQENLGYVLQAGMDASEGPALLGGCYVAGTGRDALEQAFVAGIFQRLLESQDLVTWTDETLAEDAFCHRWARRGYGILAAVAAVGMAALAYLLLDRKPTGALKK
jgi:hypothetical protein